ncbi:MAG: hypothetical protein BGO95_06320 [Micrococcales bacterium 73-13]|nr:MAG: hypothetical protein BGO95_06320 [Micrococcales bacterium 73-13]
MSWTSLPDDEKTRAAFAGLNAESLAHLGLKEHEVLVWEDGTRIGGDADRAFEWWYFDLNFDDGSTLVLTFANKSPQAPGGPIAPTLLVIRQEADGTHRKLTPTYSVAEYSAAAEGCDVRVGPNTAKGELAQYALHVEVEDLVADVVLTRAAPSWRPGSGVNYLDAAKTEYFGWVVPVPYGTATATITEGGVTKELSGTGYHDHNWGTKPLSAQTNHWFWGRAHVGDYTLIYTMVFTQGFMGLGRIQVPTFLLAKGDEILTDEQLPLRLTLVGETRGPLGHSYPERLDWVWQREGRGRIAFSSTNPKLIESLDMSVPRHGVSKLLHALEKPVYYDFNADFELTIDLDGLRDHVTGTTLYENMILH